VAVDLVGVHTRSRSYIPGSTSNCENERKIDNLGCMVYLVYAEIDVCCTRCMLNSVNGIPGVCCTRCMLYPVYAVPGVCYTQCMLYLVYAVLSLNSGSWHREIGRDDLTLCSAIILELWMRQRDGG